MAYLSKVPNADLPNPEVFRGNRVLSLKSQLPDSRIALMGKENFLGIDLGQVVTKLRWEVFAPNESGDLQIPRPEFNIGEHFLNRDRN